MHITPKRPYLIDLDEIFFNFFLFFKLFSPKQLDYKGESGMSCLAQLLRYCLGKEFKMVIFAEVHQAEKTFYPPL